MTVSVLDSGVCNQKFYNGKNGYKETVTTQTFLSGRSVSFMNNEKALKTKEVYLNLTLAEVDSFWAWYNNDLGGLTGYFTCEALGSSTWRFTETPDEGEGLKTREMKFQIEEVYI